jgi:hypothetical protein
MTWGQHGAPVWHIESAYATQDYLLRTLTYAGTMLAVVLSLSKRDHALWVLGALLAGGLLQALVGGGAFRFGQGFDGRL